VGVAEGQAAGRAIPSGPALAEDARGLSREREAAAAVATRANAREARRLCFARPERAELCHASTRYCRTSQAPLRGAHRTGISEADVRRTALPRSLSTGLHPLPPRRDRSGRGLVASGRAWRGLGERLRAFVGLRHGSSLDRGSVPAQRAAFPSVAVRADQLNVPCRIRPAHRERNDVIELEVPVGPASRTLTVVPTYLAFDADPPLAAGRHRPNRNSKA
jgi:hypothetical protein